MRLTLHEMGFVGILAISLGGCAVTFVDNSSSGAGGSGGSATTSSGNGGTASVGSGGAGGMSSSSETGVGGGPPPQPCGGFSGGQCADTEYCDFPDDICGATDGSGVCLPRPQGCPEFYSPTCACDGKVYGNPCDAASSGSDVSNLGGCMPPQGMFNCGHTFCDIATQYCQKTNSDVGGMPDSFVCAPLPMSCGMTPSCSCVGDPCGAPIPNSCSTTPEGGVFVTCPGG